MRPVAYRAFAVGLIFWFLAALDQPADLVSAVSGFATDLAHPRSSSGFLFLPIIQVEH